MADPASLFVRDGSYFLPTDLTRGPWDPRAQHGGAPGALIAQVLDRTESLVPMRIARVTIELLRPVPVHALRLETSIVRDGKRVQLLGASLYADAVQVAQASALRIRTTDLPLPPGLPCPARVPEPAAGTHSRPPWAEAVNYRSFHRDAVEHRFVRGTFDAPGPAVDWIRLRVPVLAGEVTAAVSRAVAAADFGNGISWVLSRSDGWQFINPDLTVYLHRYPAGEWICLDAVTQAEPTGLGLAESRLLDERGAIGRALQSLYLERLG